jgi:hypothetical protein
MATTAGGTHYEEMEGSPTMNVSGEGKFRGRRKFWIPNYGDWVNFLIELVGGWKRTGNQFIFVPPAPFPNWAFTFVEDVELVPADDNVDGSAVGFLNTGTNICPNGMFITASYSGFNGSTDGHPNNPTIPQGTTLDYSAGYSMENITLPSSSNGQWYWQDTLNSNDDSNKPETLPEDLPLVVNIAHTSYTLVWDRVAYPPFDAIRKQRGTVNKGSFRGASDSSVLFLGAEVSRRFNLSPDVQYWTLRYMFLEKTFADGSGAWNQLWRGEKRNPTTDSLIREAGPATPVLRSTPPGYKTLYQTSDFQNLFKFG